MITYSQKQMRDLSISASKEWLLTDGDGGYASSTVCFLNSRRQHSLLTVSTDSPLKRFTLLNKLDEEVIIDGKSYMLGTNQYPGTVFPEGYKLLSKFAFDHFPQVTYDLDGCQITKKILMPRRSSAVYVHYQNTSRKAMTLRLLPLISFRWKDSVRKAGDGFLVDELPDGVRIISEMNLPRLYLKLSQIYSTEPESHWYYDFIYSHDTDLYNEDREDLFNIGFWETELEPGKGLTFVASTRDLAEFDYAEIEARCIDEIELIRTSSGLPKRYVHLADMASNHLARSRAIRSLAILEGFPYGAISTKDSLLSIDGISCSSGRRNYEQEFLNDLVTNEQSGALPSTIDEATFQVNYDDPAIPLYFAVALKRCAQKESGTDCLRRYLPMLENSVEYITQNNFGGSLSKATHLLDVTSGKTSKIQSLVKNAAVNALWYNLLKVVDEAKSSTEALANYSEVTAEIESGYFDSFFNNEGAFKGLEENDELVSDMTLPLIIPFSPLNEKQRGKVFRQLASRLLRNLQNPTLHTSPTHVCNLMAIHLAEAGSTIEGCEAETENLKEVISELFTLRKFTDTVDGLPKCGIGIPVHTPRDISSALVTGEAIRVVKKLKLR
jgi:predicted glycogen debranching enzyme